MKSTPINKTKVVPVKKPISIWKPYSRNVAYIDPVKNLHAFVMSVHNLVIQNPAFCGAIRSTPSAISDVNSILNIRTRNERRVNLKKQPAE